MLTKHELDEIATKALEDTTNAKMAGNIPFGTRLNHGTLLTLVEMARMALEAKEVMEYCIGPTRDIKTPYMMEWLAKFKGAYAGK